MRRVLIAAVAVLMIVGCASGPMTDGGQGVVVAHSRKHRVKCSIRSCYTYKITTARDGSGTRETAQVHKDVYESCPIGTRWPDCKR